MEPRTRTVRLPVVCLLVQPARSHILRAGNFYRQIYSLLESLERLVEPRAPLSPSPNIGMLTLSAPALIAAAEPAQKEPLLSLISGYLASLEKQARELDLDSTGKRLKRLMDYVASLNAVTVETYGDEKLKHDIRVLREAFEDDLKERFIFFPSHERFKKWVTTDPFEGAKKAFPSALSDLSWAATSSSKITRPRACSI